MKRSLFLSAALMICAAALPGHGGAAERGRPDRAPLVIAHRGYPGERPEHTATGYRLAATAGADFIEPDLVMTKDGVLIDRHENEIGATTDVADHPEFAARKATKIVDGAEVTGWFTEDFTLAEIRTLRTRERLPQLRPASAAHDGEDRILTLQEVIDIARETGRGRGRRVGVYAELKHPTYFARIGLPMEAALVEVLKRNGLASRDAPVIVQCFELTPLKTVRSLLPVRTVFLMDTAGGPADLVAKGDGRSYRTLAGPEGLREIALAADGIGPSKDLIVPRDEAGRSLAPTRLVADAHAAGLFVHPFTFRAENVFLPAELRRGDASAANYQAQHGDGRAEYLQFFRLGVDGLFSDFPRAAVEARAAFAAERRTRR